MQLNPEVNETEGQSWKQAVFFLAWGLGLACILIQPVSAIFNGVAPCWNLPGCQDVSSFFVTPKKSTFGIPLWILGSLGYLAVLAAFYSPWPKAAKWVTLAGSAAALRYSLLGPIFGIICPWCLGSAFAMFVMTWLALTNLKLSFGPRELSFGGVAAALPFLSAYGAVQPAVPYVPLSVEAAPRERIARGAEPSDHVSVLWGSPWAPETLALLDSWVAEGKAKGRKLIFRYSPLRNQKREGLTAAMIKLSLAKNAWTPGAFSKENQTNPKLDKLALNLGVGQGALMIEESQLTLDKSEAAEFAIGGKTTRMECPPYTSCFILPEQ